MGQPGARMGDAHLCPGKTPAEHVGGAIVGPCEPTVLMHGQPVARVGDFAACTGAPLPNTVVSGSGSVLVGGQPAARLGDRMAHGGAIVSGEPTVLVGG